MQRGFSVLAENIRILNRPNEFFETLCNRIYHAKERVSLASLYMGTGEENQNLLRILKNKVEDTNIDLSILLDERRTTRDPKSLLRFSPRLLDNLYLFTSPFRSKLHSLAPRRVNEIFGTQHMKIYVCDDTVIISGANLSGDYFTNRQDRYWLIHDRSFSDYCWELIDCVKTISTRFDSKEYLNQAPDFEFQVKKSSVTPDVVLNDFIEFSKAKYMSLFRGGDNIAFLTPSIQMGKFFINNDYELLRALLKTIQPENEVALATAYFNVEDDLVDSIFKSKARWNILTAAPKANGFLGSRGFSGYIPYLYLHKEYSFLKKLHKQKKSNTGFFEWEKPKETFHAKGLWLSKNKDSPPHFSICGSSNFGYRSVSLDLEMQVSLYTNNTELQLELQKEKDNLFEFGREVNYQSFYKTSPDHRQIRKPWIPLMSAMMGKYL